MELAALGIDGDQEAVYRLLVTDGPASERELRDRGPVPDRHLERVLGELLDAGLATKEQGRFRAAPPELALRSLLIRRRSEFGRAENALAELTELFRVLGRRGA